MRDLPREVISTNSFKKDLKRVTRQGKELSKLKEIVAALRKDVFLVPQSRDHFLNGNWINHRE